MLRRDTIENKTGRAWKDVNYNIRFTFENYFWGWVLKIAKISLAHLSWGSTTSSRSGDKGFEVHKGTCRGTNLCRSTTTDTWDNTKGSRNRFFGTSLFSMQKMHKGGEVRQNKVRSLSNNCNKGALDVSDFLPSLSQDTSLTTIKTKGKAQEVQRFLQSFALVRSQILPSQEEVSCGKASNDGYILITI